MLRGFSASLAMHQLLLNVARLLCLTCRGLHALPARLSLHALPSRARHWLKVRTIMFSTLTISSMNCTRVTFTIPAISGNFCNTESQAQLDINGSLNGRKMEHFSAPLHLLRLSLHHDSTLFCCGGFGQSCGEIRLYHLEPPNDSCALSSPP